jgi:MFS family permease
VQVGGNYWHDLFPSMVLLGIGMGGTFIAITIAATSGVTGRESGLASGLLNTSQQVGGALGLAILTGLAASTTSSYLHHLHGAPSRLTPLTAEVHGFHSAFYLGCYFMLGAVVLATFALKQPKGIPASEQADAIAMH